MLSRTVFRAVLWGVALAAVTAAWVLAWRHAPFPGWDYVFYALLAGFLLCSWGAGAALEWRSLVEDATLTPEQVAELVDRRKRKVSIFDPPTGEKSAFPPPTLPQTLWAVMVITVGLGGVYYSYFL